MKKKIAIALALIMIITMFAFTGCGGSADKAGGGTVSEQQADQNDNGQDEGVGEDDQEQITDLAQLEADYQTKLTSGTWYHTYKPVVNGEAAGTYIYSWEFDKNGNLHMACIMENAGFAQYIDGTYSIGEAIDGGYIIGYNGTLKTAYEEGTDTEAANGSLNFCFDDSGKLNMSYAAGNFFKNYVNGQTMQMSHTKGECEGVVQLTYEG